MNYFKAPSCYQLR